MTDAPPQPAAPAPLDPNELMQLRLTRSDIANLMVALDLVRRNCKLDEVTAVMGLIEKLSRADTVANRNALEAGRETSLLAQANRHTRRAKGAKA